MTLRDFVCNTCGYPLRLFRPSSGQTGANASGAAHQASAVARGAAWAATFGISLSVGLMGCGIGEQMEALAPGSETIAAAPVNGNVHGGVYPIVGATIRLMQTVTNASYVGTGGTTVPASTYGSAAKTLLTATSDANGGFSFADGWPCATNEFAYLVVTGGHTSNLPAGSVNNSVIQVGVVGPCSKLSTAAMQHPVNVFLSEVSTVATAAALGNFTSISPNDGSGSQIVNIGAPLKNSTALNCPSGNTCASGLEHGFTNAATLVNSVSLTGANLTGEGNFVNALSAGGSQIPAALINTIGNVMQDCVDSADGSPACTSLFSKASAPGATVPANTLQAALNMVQNPSYNVANLFALQQPNAPFTPNLATAPTSFAVSIFYGVSFNGASGASLNQYPIDVALDASDNAFVLFSNAAPGTAGNYAAVDEWLASGSLNLTGSHNATYVYPQQIALDPTGNVYVTNNDPTVVNDGVLALSGGVLTSVATVSGASGIALNSSGNLFVSSVTTGATSIAEYIPGSFGTVMTLKAATAAAGPTYGLAVDSNLNVWGAAKNSTGTVQAFVWPKTTSSTFPYTAGSNVGQAFTGASAPLSVSLSSSGTAYFPMNDELMSATYGSQIVVNSAVAPVSAEAVPHRSQTDGSGRVFWTDLESTGNVNYYTSGLSPAVTSFLPCFTIPTVYPPTASTTYVCITSSNQTTQTSDYTPAYLRGMAIDSAGNIWYLADAGYGAVIETLGVASPTWPLLSYGHPGTKPQ